MGSPSWQGAGVTLGSHVMAQAVGDSGVLTVARGRGDSGVPVMARSSGGHGVPTTGQGRGSSGVPIMARGDTGVPAMARVRGDIGVAIMAQGRSDSRVSVVARVRGDIGVPIMATDRGDSGVPITGQGRGDTEVPVTGRARGRLLRRASSRRCSWDKQVRISMVLPRHPTVTGGGQDPQAGTPPLSPSLSPSPSSTHLAAVLRPGVPWGRRRHQQVPASVGQAVTPRATHQPSRAGECPLPRGWPHHGGNGQGPSRRPPGMGPALPVPRPPGDGCWAGTPCPTATSAPRILGVTACPTARGPCSS